MSAEDRERWEARYAGGAYRERKHPSALLQRYAEALSAGRVLDVASGAGRNSLFLAARGFQAHAIDISRNALQRLADDAAAQGLDVTTEVWDFDDGVPPDLPRFSNLLVIRYLNLALLSSLLERLEPGGLLICEVLFAGLADDQPTNGPKASRFRVAPGELAEVAGGMEVMHYYEGAVTDPDGSTSHVAQVVARQR